MQGVDGDRFNYPEEYAKEYYHNWLYSVVPVGPQFTATLAAYCRTCDQGFIREIPSSSDPVKMNVPKTGCIEVKLPI